MKVTKEQWQQVLEAHLSFEEAGGNRQSEWEVQTEQGPLP